MIRTDYLTKYFPHGTQPSLTTVAACLSQDLAKRTEEIYSQILPKEAPVSSLLQPTKNSLRHSVGEIRLENKPVFESTGQCHGACLWFIALFLNLKAKHPDIPTHTLLTQISQEFADGVGIQGALLQKYDDADGELLRALNLNHGNKIEKELKNKDSSKELLDAILDLSDGVYLLSFSGAPGGVGWGLMRPIAGHATVGVVENKNYYFLDPNVGLSGAGPNIESQSIFSDALCLLRICNQYSPYERADALFKQGVEQLSKMFHPQEEAKLFEKVALESREKGSASLGAYPVMAIHDGFTTRGYVFSKEDFDNMLGALCIDPGILQMRLEESEAIRFYRYTSLN